MNRFARAIFRQTLVQAERSGFVGAPMMMVDPPRNDNLLERRDFLRRHRMLLVGFGDLKGVRNSRRPAEPVGGVDDQVHGEPWSSPGRYTSRPWAAVICSDLPISLQDRAVG